MNRSILLILSLLFVLSSCKQLSEPASFSSGDIGSGNKLENGCISPIASFHYPANLRHSTSDKTKQLPPAPWQVEALLPTIPLEGHSYDWISIALTKDSHTEVWVKRTLDSRTGNTSKTPIVQVLVYRTDTKQWASVPIAGNEKKPISGNLYQLHDNSVWAEFTFPGDSLFALYSEKEEKFELVESSKEVPKGPRLLDKDDSFWILTPGDGIYRYIPTIGDIRKHIDIPDLNTGTSLYGSMSSLAPDGSIFFLNVIGESNTQLMRFDPKTGRLNSLPYIDYMGEAAYYLFVDHSNRVWLSDLGWLDSDGVWQKIVRSPLFITDRGEREWQYVWARPSIVLESSNGLLWFQSANGLTWLDSKQGKWCWFTTERSNIVEDDQHFLWMIADGKLYKYSPNP